MAFADNLKGKKGLVFALGGGVVVVGFLYWRRHQATATASAGQGAVTDPGYIDPGNLDSGYGTLGFGGAGGGGGYYPGVDTSSLLGTSPGTFTNNAQWAQYAEQALAGVVDASALSAALGKYLTGQVVTADQSSMISQAIAIAGYPPVGGPGGSPPAIHTTGGGGGGQGGGGSGAAGYQAAAPGGKTFTQIASDVGVTYAALVKADPGVTAKYSGNVPAGVSFWVPAGNNGQGVYAGAGKTTGGGTGGSTGGGTGSGTNQGVPIFPVGTLFIGHPVHVDHGQTAYEYPPLGVTKAANAGLPMSPYAVVVGHITGLKRPGVTSNSMAYINYDPRVTYPGPDLPRGLTIRLYQG